MKGSICLYKNILISALVNLGDVVLTTGALSLIKQQFPATRITVMVKRVVSDAVLNNPVIDDVIILDYRSKENSLSKMFSTVKEIRRRQFDLYISLDRKLRPALLAFLARIPKRVGPDKVFDDNRSRVTSFYTDVVAIDHDLNGTLQAETYQKIVRHYLSIDGAAQPVFANITEQSRSAVDRLFNRLKHNALKIALCVKGTFELKTYPKEYFSHIVRTLDSEFDAAFFIIGAPNDRPYADEVIADIDLPVENFCGETSLVDLAEMFNRSDLFISVDTGAAHIAATTGVKMVVMYGCTPVERWRPINPNAIALSSREHCCPCSVKPDQCPSHPKPNCLYNILPEQVLDACRQLIGGSQRVGV